jgi:DNA gyrase subunit B
MKKLNKNYWKMKTLSASLSARAKKQWENETYKENMKQKFQIFWNSSPEYQAKEQERLYALQKDYWADKEHRAAQSQRTKEYFINHPEAIKRLSTIAKEQWNDQELRIWRAATTKNQWTDDFREKRKAAYNQTYYHQSMNLLKTTWEKYGTIVWYDLLRRQAKNHSLLKLETVKDRFFAANETAMLEAIKNYNHKIKAIIPLEQKIDVYDLEVSGTHNFALASGVFVHNSAKQGRNRKFQAILPLRGKILNVERARMDKMLANQEIKNLVIAMGTNIDDQFDISKLRYHRIIIMTDADVDGAHICTLLLTLFFRHFPRLIEEGHIYIALPPLYQLRKGTTVRYAYSDEEKMKIITEMGGSADEAEEIEETDEGETETVETATDNPEETKNAKKKPARITIQRYKGLGEMNAEQLWDTTMDPEKRIVKQVTIEDAGKADVIFDMLMGDNVGPRKNFIQTHAKSVANLDI